MSGRNSHRIAVAMTNAAPILEFAVVYEVFGIDRTDIVDPWYDLRLCGVQPGPLSTTAGFVAQPQHGLADLLDADTLLVPACTRAVQLDPPADLLDVLRVAHEQGRRIMSICSGAYVLAAAGLLDGRHAATHWMTASDLAHRYPDVKVDPNVLYVDDGDILTSAGTGAAIDLCLHVVRLDHGSAVANEVARRMVVPPHRDGGQAQFAQPVSRGATANGDLGPVLEWARHRLDQPLTVAQLAKQAHRSPRTFARHFRDVLGTSPLQWLLEQRVRLAQELLETTDEPVEQIARRTGFGSAANLRQHFGRITSISPQSYRHVFRHRARGPGRVI